MGEILPAICCPLLHLGALAFIAKLRRLDRFLIGNSARPVHCCISSAMHHKARIAISWHRATQPLVCTSVEEYTSPTAPHLRKNRTELGSGKILQGATGFIIEPSCQCTVYTDGSLKDWSNCSVHRPIFNATSLATLWASHWRPLHPFHADSSSSSSSSVQRQGCRTPKSEILTQIWPKCGI